MQLMSKHYRACQARLKLAYGDIVPDDGWQGSVLRVVLCHMHHNIVLNVAVLANLDAVDVRCNMR